MNRRNFLIAGGGTLAALAGGTAVADATRADIPADGKLTRGKGEDETVEKTISRESVEYLKSTNEVREKSYTQPFDTWARRECAEIGADKIVPIVDDRLETAVSGVGSGVRYLIFGPVITADHKVARDRDGSIIGEPNVTLEQLTSVAPRTITVTVSLAGRTFTKGFPVGVGHSEVYNL
ncbi:hypothetical protein [Haloferax larsenii]|uniref:Uncharacterized protein n=1 Tax=Haloferax larsenii TaxID=302484 RepID=A0A1H7Q2P9_HALLR|nr:hypothetical protein [Haloferax larsenii]SEL41998.1 hypothetical protein SAMN04488691_104278 [Haloferax larsenii]